MSITTTSTTKERNILLTLFDKIRYPFSVLTLRFFSSCQQTLITLSLKENQINPFAPM
jgi:hypothetical protein